MNGNKKKNFEREGIKKPDSIRRYWEGNGKEKEGRIREKEGDKEKENEENMKAREETNYKGK